MKKIIFIIGLLSAIMLFTSQEKEKQNDIALFEHTETMQEINITTDIQYRISQLSDALRKSTLLTPHRQIQPTSHYINTRLTRNISRVSQNIRLKEAEQFFKVSAYISKQQTINYSALLSGMGYHIYTLRKIII